MWQVIGQERIVTYLQKRRQEGRLAHAYLLVGPPQVGKATLALDLARAVNCPQTEAPCGQCLACLRIGQGFHPDVQMVSRQEAKTEISIDQIKQVLASTYLHPFEGQHKVFILDGAEYLSTEAANCLLKTLEEPPPGVLFLLLSSREAALPITIVSRCQRIELKPLPREVVVKALIQRWKFSDDKAQLLASLCQGRLGWALNPDFLERREDWLHRLEQLVAGDLEKRFAMAAEIVQIWDKGKEAVAEGLDIWELWWRDLLLLKVRAGAGRVNWDRKELSSQACRWSLSQVKTALRSLAAAREQLMGNANPRLAFEVLMLNLPLWK